MALYRVNANVAAANRVLNAGEVVEIDSANVSLWQSHIDSGLLTKVGGSGPQSVTNVDKVDPETVTETGDETPAEGSESGGEGGEAGEPTGEHDTASAAAEPATEA